MKFENLEEYQTVTLGNTIYKIAYFLENKNDASKRVFLKEGCVKKFSYFDDIANIGLSGSMIIQNVGGEFNEILNYTDQYYIGFYSEDISSLGENQSGHKESIYFSIVKSNIIERSITATSADYSLTLQEAFIVTAASKTFNFLRSGIQDGIGIIPEENKKNLAQNLNILKSNIENEDLSVLEDKNLHSLILLTLALTIANLVIPEENQSGTQITEGFFANNNSFSKVDSEKRIIDIDEISIKYFKDHYATDTIGTKLYENISNIDSCYDVLTTINKNYFTRAIVDTKDGKTSAVSNLMGDFALARNENISYLPFMLPDLYTDNLNGERQFTIKNISTLLKLAFKDNLVYEKLIKQDSNIDNYKDIKAPFIKKTMINQSLTYPINTSLVIDQWADTVIEPLMSNDVISRTFLKFDDVLDYFEKTHLNSNYISNIEQDKIKSRALRTQAPCFDEEELNYTVCAKIIKSFLTLNEMTTIILPGFSYRKANEIIFIDPEILKSNLKESGTTTFGNSLQNNYYYVTRVEHNIEGNNYTNTLSLCSFCKKKQKNS